MAAEVLHEAREDFDPVSARSAELMQTELDRFEALLTDLLEISRFDAGAAVLSADVVDLREIVDRVLESHGRLAEAYGAEISVHVAGRRRRQGRGRRSPDRADRAQPAGERDRAQRGQADRDPDRGRRGAPLPSRCVTMASASRRARPAGVPPVLAGRPGPGPDGGRYRARPGHLDGGREPARRLADRLGPAWAGRPVPADPAPAAGGGARDLAAARWCRATWCPRHETQVGGSRSRARAARLARPLRRRSGPPAESSTTVAP